MALEDAIERVLWTRGEISMRVAEMASSISSDLAREKGPIVVVGVATGAFMFLADLVRAIKVPLAVDFIRAGSYDSQTVSSGDVKISSDVKLEVEGRHVLLVEDIVDTGHTLSRVVRHLKSKGARCVSVCTLLDKPARRKVPLETIDGFYYSGFEVSIALAELADSYLCSSCSSTSISNSNWPGLLQL